jgi:hypothetical protein
VAEEGFSMKKLIIASMFLLATLGMNATKASAGAITGCTHWAPAMYLWHVGQGRYCTLTGWEFIWYN